MLVVITVHAQTRSTAPPVLSLHLAQLAQPPTLLEFGEIASRSLSFLLKVELRRFYVFGRNLSVLHNLLLLHRECPKGSPPLVSAADTRRPESQIGVFARRRDSVIMHIKVAELDGVEPVQQLAPPHAEDLGRIAHAEGLLGRRCRHPQLHARGLAQLRLVADAQRRHAHVQLFIVGAQLQPHRLDADLGRLGHQPRRLGHQRLAQRAVLLRPRVYPLHRLLLSLHLDRTSLTALTRRRLMRYRLGAALLCAPGGRMQAITFGTRDPLCRLDRCGRQWFPLTRQYLGLVRLLPFRFLPRELDAVSCYRPTAQFRDRYVRSILVAVIACRLSRGACSDDSGLFRGFELLRQPARGFYPAARELLALIFTPSCDETGTWVDELFCICNFDAGDTLRSSLHRRLCFDSWLFLLAVTDLAMILPYLSSFVLFEFANPGSELFIFLRALPCQCFHVLHYLPCTPRNSLRCAVFSFFFSRYFTLLDFRLTFLRVVLHPLILLLLTSVAHAFPFTLFLFINFTLGLPFLFTLLLSNFFTLLLF
mmetsp:Transcript_17239/g.37011  ORF Transcript_17239/g.37011 Transcript_17239/m.37011 type:complete len:536 (+) Transcript_17239:924-2531(+)